MNPLCCDDQNKRGLHTLEGKKVTDMKVFFSPLPLFFFSYKGADGMQRREEGREMKDRGKAWKDLNLN